MNTRRVLLYVGLALAVILVFGLGQALWVTLLSAAVAAVVAVLLHRRLGESPGPEPDAVPEPGARSPWIEHLNSLAHLNLAIRENALTETVMARLESSIDGLRRLLPELAENHPGSELTWIVSRMATDYLPRVVTPFIGLSPGVRGEHADELLKSLEGLEAELQSIEELVRGQKVGEFKSKAAFLRVRFLEDPGP